MNEPKRRGRPPKARIEGADVVALPVREMTAQEKIGATAAEVVNVWADRNPRILAQAYAMRVWNGQSPNVPRNERIKRVKAALVGQNLPTEGIELP